MDTTKTHVRIAVFNNKTGQEVKNYPVKNQYTKDITKYRWHKWKEDGEFNANMTIVYSELRLGRGLHLKIVDCDEKGN